MCYLSTLDSKEGKMAFRVLIIHSLSVIIRAVNQTAGWAACRLTTWILWSALNRWQADLWASWLWRTYTAPHSTPTHALQLTKQHTETRWKSLQNTCLETSPLCWNVDAITIIHSHTSLSSALKRRQWLVFPFVWRSHAGGTAAQRRSGREKAWRWQSEGLSTKAKWMRRLRFGCFKSAH